MIVPARNTRTMTFDDEPGVLGTLARPLLRHPMDSLAAAMAVAASVAVVINALAFQTGPHPSPIFAAPPRLQAPAAAAVPAPVPPVRAVAAPRSAVTPTPAPVNSITSMLTPAPATPAQAPAPEASRENTMLRDVQVELARLGRYDGAPDGLMGPKTDAAIRDYERAIGRAPTGEASAALLAALKAPPRTEPATTASAPAAQTRRILTIQKVLAEQGYGPIKLDGVLGEGTKAAIFRFEIHRNLPPTGEINPRMVRELSAISGVRIE